MHDLSCIYLVYHLSKSVMTWNVPVALFVERGSLAQNFYMQCLALTSATFASATTNLVPAITFVLAICFRLEKLNWDRLSGKAKVMGTLLGITGAMVLTFYKGPDINIWDTHVNLLDNVHHHGGHVPGTHPNRILGKDGGALPLSVLLYSPDGYNGINLRHTLCIMCGKGLESMEVGMEHQTPLCYLLDPSRFRFAHQTSFVRRHSGLSNMPGVRYIVAFFRQFFASVTKVDYMAMRHRFINAHFVPNSKFNFHKYIKRSMEDDFKVVVGISIPLWTFAVIFQLPNVYKWYTFIGLAFVPPTILLIVGTKLELIIMDMAHGLLPNCFE